MNRKFWNASLLALSTVCGAVFAPSMASSSPSSDFSASSAKTNPELRQIQESLVQTQSNLPVTPLFRLSLPGANSIRLHTIFWGEVQTLLRWGFVVEGVESYLLAPQSTIGYPLFGQYRTVPVPPWTIPDFVYTTNPVEANLWTTHRGYQAFPEPARIFMFDIEVVDPAPVYRTFDPATKVRRYTSSPTEMKTLTTTQGHVLEAIVGYGVRCRPEMAAPLPNGTPTKCVH